MRIEVIRQILKRLAETAQAEKKPLEHILFYGGFKAEAQQLAQTIVHMLKVNIRTTAGANITTPVELAAILTHLRSHDVLYIQEIHRLDKSVVDMLGLAMSDFILEIFVGEGEHQKQVRLNLPPFTLIGSTLRPSWLKEPLPIHFSVQFRIDD